MHGREVPFPNLYKDGSSSSARAHPVVRLSAESNYTVVVCECVCVCVLIGQ